MRISGRARAPVILPILLAILALFSTAPARHSAQEQQRGSISGQVIADAGISMERVSVWLIDRVRNRTVQTAKPDREGRFIFTGLAPQFYLVSAGAPGYIVKRGANTSKICCRAGDTATVELVKGSAITGRVTDRHGEPVVAARVIAIRVRHQAGKPEATTGAGASAYTDDRGIYRIYGLSAGTYIAGVNINRTFGGSLSAYDEDVPIYFPSSGRAQAGEIEVTEGSEVRGIDIAYRRERGFAISGKVEGADEAGGQGSSLSVALQQYPAGPVMSMGAIDVYFGQRAFTMSGVADGEYQLTANGRTGSGEVLTSEPQRISVRGRDLTGVVLTVKPLGGMSGRVVVDKAKAALPKTCRGIHSGALEEILVRAVRLVSREQESSPGYGSGASAGSPVERDQFMMRNMYAGEYRLLLDLPGGLWYPQAIALERARARAVDLRAGALPVKWGEVLAGVTVRLGEGAAELTGQVDGLQGRARVHLIPAGPGAAEQILRYAETISRSDGRYELRHLAPGRYLAIALALDNEPHDALAPPKAWDAAERERLRRLAEAKGQAIELRPCERVKDYRLSPLSAAR